MPVSFEHWKDIDHEQIRRDFDASLERNLRSHMKLDKLWSEMDKVLKTGDVKVSNFVPGKLQALVKLYEERNKVYGNDYHENGKLMATLFPNGLTLKTENDFNRYSILIHIVTKLGRYVRNFKKGHEDSLDDLIVYAAILAELDQPEGGYND